MSIARIGQTALFRSDTCETEILNLEIGIET